MSGQTAGNATKTNKKRHAIRHTVQHFALGRLYILHFTDIRQYMVNTLHIAAQVYITFYLMFDMHQNTKTNVLHVENYLAINPFPFLHGDDSV